MLTAVLVFAGVAALVNITPGLDTLLVLRASLAHGRKAGRAAALGILLGCLVWGLAAAVGLTALLTASHIAYDGVRIAGACYLAWLGASALWRTRRRPCDGGGDSPAPDEIPDGRMAAFRSGLGTNLLNPKAGVFYMSLVPQFLPHGAPVFGSTLLFTAIDVMELAVWYWVVSGAAAALGERLRRPCFRRRTEQASGLALLGFAAGLAVEST
ncbi:lysine transporter LysE [Streptomyces sp. CB02488]|uniref:LysE family translocator n=1 Tax=Streptomyces sp. CB02488 TaxID=1703920 RepID=UPI00093A5AD2|nr:LysE family translocator [Streptomyces sp. CB02488]OKK09295.1 lysine transporter LysE [Streptomyces sp. CB02488]